MVSINFLMRIKGVITFLALLAALQFGSATTASAQASFDVKLFGLMNGQGKDGAKLHFGASRESVAKMLGQPNKKERLVDEIEGGFYEVVYYRTNKLFFKKNQLEGFELHDNSLAYGKSPETAFRVGAKISFAAKPSKPSAVAGANYRLSGKPLTDFEVDTKPGKSRNVPYSLVALSYPKYGATLGDDGGLELLFDASHKLIMLAF